MDDLALDKKIKWQSLVLFYVLWGLAVILGFILFFVARSAFRLVLFDFISKEWINLAWATVAEKVFVVLIGVSVLGFIVFAQDYLYKALAKSLLLKRFLLILGFEILVISVFAVVFIIFNFFPNKTTKLVVSVESPEKTELHITGADPYNRISDEETYRLRVWGKVKKELSLTLDEIKSMPSVERGNPIDCVVGWTDEATWRGVLISDILQKTSVEGDGKFVVFRDDRNYSSTLSVDYINSGKPILAYEVDGEPLPREHGWPLRVVAPDKWGYKWVKWVTSMEVTNRGYEGTYEESGFSLDGDLDGPKLEADKKK